jgi:hypothetical protein
VRLGIGRKVAWGGLYLYAAWLVAYFFLHFGGVNFYPAASMDAMVAGTASKPYIGRMLVPFVMRGIDAGSPQPVRDAVQAAFTNEDFLPDFYKYTVNPGEFPFNLAVFYVLAVAMYAGVAFGGRAAFISVFGQRGFVANLAGLLFLIAVPLWFRYICYIYDPMTVLLATWMLVAAVRTNLWVFAILFILACFNKETAPLAIPVVLYASSKKYHRYVTFGYGAFLVVAAVLVQAVRTGLYDQPGIRGSWTEQHWADHQMNLFTHFQMSLLYSFVVLGTLLWLALWRFKEKPMILRVGFFFTFIPLFLASIPFGFIDEIRALYDAYPYVMLLGMPTLLGLLGAPFNVQHEREALLASA